MLTIYTSYNCSSCKKSMMWLKEHGISHDEHNFFAKGLSEKDVYHILKYTENGFEDIVSVRSKVYLSSKDDIDDMTIKELVNFIIEHPSVLRRPIIVDDVTESVQVGYDISEFQGFI
ncbi:MAG: Spx/MgsR family RNA polymerase-binding regulatory protein [Mycoplasmatales bacterium]